MTINTGKDLKKWRKENNLTQKQLADLTGYSKDRIAHVESKDIPVSNRLKRQILQENNNLNPPKPLLLKTIEQFLYYNKERNYYFSIEIKPLEENITTIFNSIPKGFEKTKDYLTLLNTWCCAFLQMMSTTYTTQNEYNNKTNKILGNLRKYTREYIKNYGNGKEK